MKRLLVCALLLGGCAATPEPPAPEPVAPEAPAADGPEPIAEAPASEPERKAARAARSTPRSSGQAASDAFKRDVAVRIAQANGAAIADSLPQMLKSVVVLNVSVDSRGNLTHVSVRRSNGYRDLENRAMESVRRAAPFAPPGRSVSFLETFLFRDDGRFQLRTLVN